MAVSLAVVDIQIVNTPEHLQKQKQIKKKRRLHKQLWRVENAQNVPPILLLKKVDTENSLAVVSTQNVNLSSLLTNRKTLG